MCSDHKAVFLVGPMGAGKSTIGRQLSQRFEGGFVDLDNYIVKVAGKSILQISLSKMVRLTFSTT